MKTNTFRAVVAGIALTALAAVNAFAQVGRIEGDVKKKGTGELIPNAQIDIVRTDIKGNYPVKSDKKGHFLHAGVPYVGTYTLLISADGCEPTFLSGIRPTGEPIIVELNAGDGRKLTIEQIKQFQTGGGQKPGGGGAPQMSAAEMKKQQEEYDKKRTEIESQNAKSKADFEGMKKFFDSGQAKFAAKDYAGAITDYNEAAKLDADQTAIWGNLGLALYNRGVTFVNESLKDMAKRDPAKQDFNDAVSAVGKAITLNEKDIADPAKAQAAKKNKVTYVKIKADAEGLLATRLGVMEMADASVKDYKEAAALTEVPEEKKNFVLKAAKVYFDAGKSEEAVAAYTEILTTDPDNIEALYNLGLAYAGIAKFQESADTLQKFLDKAPADDTRVAEVKVVLKDLIVGNNLKPPKAEPEKKGKAPAKTTKKP